MISGQFGYTWMLQRNQEALLHDKLRLYLDSTASYNAGLKWRKNISLPNRLCIDITCNCILNATMQFCLQSTLMILIPCKLILLHGSPFIYVELLTQSFTFPNNYKFTYLILDSKCTEFSHYNSWSWGTRGWPSWYVWNSPIVVQKPL